MQGLIESFRGCFGVFESLVLWFLGFFFGRGVVERKMSVVLLWFGFLVVVVVYYLKS